MNIDWNDCRQACTPKFFGEIRDGLRALNKAGVNREKAVEDLLMLAQRVLFAAGGFFLLYSIQKAPVYCSLPVFLGLGLSSIPSLFLGIGIGQIVLRSLTLGAAIKTRSLSMLAFSLLRFAIGWGYLCLYNKGLCNRLGVLESRLFVPMANRGAKYLLGRRC